MWTTRLAGLPGMTAEMNRLRDELDRAFGRGVLGDGGGRRRGGYPPVNIWEDDDNVYVESEIPGFEADAVELFVNGDNQLTIQGQRQRPEVEGGRWHRQERSFGTFSRMIRLPSDVDPDNVDAAFREGVLKVTLSKKPESKPRRIEVKASS
jgi:HSP20 family protein